MNQVQYLIFTKCFNRLIERWKITYQEIIYQDLGCALGTTSILKQLNAIKNNLYTNLFNLYILRFNIYTTFIQEESIRHNLFTLIYIL